MVNATGAADTINVPSTAAATAKTVNAGGGLDTLFLFKQLTWAVLGLLFLSGLMRVDYRHYRQPIVVWGLLCAVTVALLAVLFGPTINGTRRWFGVAGIGVQPSELAKIAAIFFTAALLERRMAQIDDWRATLAPIGLMVAVLAGLIVLEPDFGTSVSLVATVAVMVFAAGVSYRYVLAGAAASVPLVVVAVLAAPYRLQRVLTFLDPWKDQQGAGFQVIQSLFAVGSGGVTGRGLMAGVLKMFGVSSFEYELVGSRYFGERWVKAVNSVLVASAPAACGLLVTRSQAASARAPRARRQA